MKKTALMSFLSLRRKCLVAAAASVLILIAAPYPDSRGQSTYSAGTPLSIRQGAGPGSIIRAEPLPGAPEGATAYRILYQSTGLQGEPIPVSGMVIVPRTSPPAGGRPIVGWAHPTTGVVSRCAPSLARKRFEMIAGLRLLLAHGYTVAATDYPGLGTPEPHPYLVGVSEGRAVLDSIRAARALPDAAGTRFAVWGHSQGGQAALFTGLLAQSYAPELRLLGVAAAAPATELATLMNADLDSSGGRNLTAMALWSWARVFHAPMDKVLVPAAVPIVNLLAQQCIESIFDIVVRRLVERPLARRFLRVRDFSEAEPWSSLLAENTPGALPPEYPVFLAQGLSDQLVLPRVTRDYMRKLCGNGSAVAFYPVPGVGHGFVAFKSSEAAVSWIDGRFAGQPAPNSCGSG